MGCGAGCQVLGCSQQVRSTTALLPSRSALLAPCLTEVLIGVSSWGTWWGDGGWAKIIRGTNNLGIELQDVYWALPDARDFPQ